MGAIFNWIAPDQLEVVRDMSEYCKTLPTMMQWSLWLKLMRPEHATFVGDDINNLVLFTCIACGDQFNGYPGAYRSKMRASEPYKIRIGTFVRAERSEFKYDQVKSLKITTKGYAPTPVQKRGLGCPKCTAVYADKETKAAGQRIAAEQLNTAYATLAQLKGCANQGCGEQVGDCKCAKFKPHTFKSITVHEPQIDIMHFQSPNCEHCKDTYHRWDQARSVYVLCECYKQRS